MPQIYPTWGDTQTILPTELHYGRRPGTLERLPRKGDTKYHNFQDRYHGDIHIGANNDTNNPLHQGWEEIYQC